MITDIAWEYIIHLGGQKYSTAIDFEIKLFQDSKIIQKVVFFLKKKNI